MRRGEIRDPIMTLVLTWLTCGFYYWYWMYKASEEVNAGLGREEYDPGIELLLGIVTFGFWIIWWDWRMSESIYEMEQRWGLAPKMEPALMFLTNFFGLGPLFYQRSMNHAWEYGQPGAAPPQRLEHQHPQGMHHPQGGHHGQHPQQVQHHHGQHPQQAQHHHGQHGGVPHGQAPQQPHHSAQRQPGAHPHQPQPRPQGQAHQGAAPQSGSAQGPSNDEPQSPPGADGDWKGGGDWE